MSRSRRAQRALLLTSALAGCALVAMPAAAQNNGLPQPFLPGDSRISTADGTMTVNLDGRNQIIDYRRFTIDEGRTVNFIDGVNGNPTLSVINRISNLVVNPQRSIINGAITSDPNVSVWLINPEGVTFGRTGSFAGGSLVVSTLPPTATDEDFLNGAGTMTQFRGGSKNSIVFVGGDSAGRIEATKGSIVAIGQSIDAGKTMEASSGAVALVAATDVTFTSGVSNPLSITIGRGTRLGTAQIGVSGDLTGQSIRIVGGAQNAVTGALLNVDAGATLTATRNGGSIVIATASTSGVTIGNGAGIAPGIASAGALETTGPNGDIVVNGAGTVVLTGALRSTRDVTIDGAGAVSIAGVVEARQDIVLGDVTVDAALRLRSARGDITTGALTSLNDAIEIDAQRGSIESGVLNAQTSITLSARQDIRLVSATAATGSILLTSARGDISGVAGPPSTNRPLAGFGRAALTANGAVQTVRVIANEGTAQLGAVTAGAGANGLGADQIFVGADAIDIASAEAFNGAIRLTGGGTTRAGMLTTHAATGDVIVSTTGDAIVDGAVSSAGNYSVTGASVTLGLDTARRVQSANGAVTITADTGDIRGLGALRLQSNRDGAGRETLSLIANGGAVNFTSRTAGDPVFSKLLGGTAANRSDVIIGSAAAITLGDVMARSLRSQGNPSELLASGAITLGDVRVDQSLLIRSTGGSIDTGDLTSTTGAIDLSALTGGVTLRSAQAAGAIDIDARDDIRLTSATTERGSITIASSAGDISGRKRGAPIADGRPLRRFGRADLTASGAGRTIDVTANAGTVQLGDVRAGAGAIDLGGDQVNISAGALDIDRVSARNGSIDLDAVGGAARLGTLNAGTRSIVADISIDATGAATVTGNVGASGAYRVTGASVTLGRDAGAVTQRADGAVTITATTGDILGRGRLRLRSNADGSGGEALSLLASAGLIDFSSTAAGDSDNSTLIGGTVRNRSDIILDGRETIPPEDGRPTVTLGDIVARTVSDGSTTGVTITGPVTLGSVRLERALDLATDDGAIVIGGVRIRTEDESLRISAGGTTSDLTTGLLRTRGGDILLTAGRDVTTSAISSLDLTPASGTIAILAGRNVGATLLAGGEDVAVRAGGMAALGTVTARDDIGLRAEGAMTLDRAQTFGGGADTRDVVFAPALAGDRGGISFGAATAPPGANIRITAASLASLTRLDGRTGKGLVVGTLRGGAFDLTADDGDIRLRDLTATVGDIAVTAGRGSISGRTTGSTDYTTGGATIRAPGSIVLEALGGSGTFAVGEIRAGDGISSEGSFASLRLGDVRADSLSLTATSDLQVDGGRVDGLVSLRTTGGTPAPFALTDAVLAARFDGANLATTASGATIDVRATTGAAQLGGLRAGRADDTTIAGDQIAVRAAAIDVTRAVARNGGLSLVATHGRLTLDRGVAATTASLVKEDADLPGVSKTPADNVLRVTDRITAGTGVSIRSLTGMTIAAATATTGDLTLNARQDAILGTGTATTGTVRLLTGGALAADTIVAGEDVAGRSGGAMTIRSLTARDTIDLIADGRLTVTSGETRAGGGGDDQRYAFDLARAGFDDAITNAPGAATDGSIALIGNDVRIGTVTSAIGTIGVTATGGDVSGLAGDPAGAEPLFVGFGRGDLIANGANGAIVIEASNGGVQLGTVRGGIVGAAPLGGDQIDVTARAIDLTNVQADNGRLRLTATDGRLWIDTGSAALDARLTKNGSGEDLFVRTRLDAGGDAILSSGFQDPIPANPALVTNTDIRAAEILAGGDLLVYASRDVLIGSGNAGGTIAINAGRDVAGLGDGGGTIVGGVAVGLGAALAAGEDIAVNAGRSATLGLIRAGDDIEVRAGSQASLVSGTALGTGPDARRVVFGINTIAFAAAPGDIDAQSGGNIGVSAQTALANTLSAAAVGDIRISAGLSASIVDATAGASGRGSIAILSGGAVTSTGTLSAAEDVAVDAAGAVSLATVAAGDDIAIGAIGAITIGAATADGLGSDTRSVAFSPAFEGRPEGIVFAGESARLTNSNIVLSGDAIAATRLTASAIGDIRVSAATRASIADATAGASGQGSIAILAGTTVTSTGTLSAAEDVAISATGDAAFGTLLAGDDIDIAAGGNVSLVDARTTAGGVDTRSIGFTPAIAGQPGAIDPFGAEPGVLQGSNIRIAAASLNGPAIGGSELDGLELDGLTVGNATVTADTGDIRIGTLTATGGDLAVTSSRGSVSGLATDFVATTGGSTIVSRGNVTFVVDGDISVGALTAGGAVSTTGASADTVRIGTVAAGTLDLTAETGLRIDGGSVAGAATLLMTGGSAGAVDLTGATLVSGHGQATLAAPANTARIVVTAGGAAQLGSVAAGVSGGAGLPDAQVAVTAAAIDIGTATVRNGGLSLLATDGRLTLGTGSAATTATLVKLDDDAGGTAADRLNVTMQLTAGEGISIRSLTDAAVVSATAATGDLTINARRNATLTTGVATTGSIGLVAMGTITAGTLTATAEDIAIRAGGDATLGTLTAGDNLDLAAGATLTLARGSTTGGGTDNRTFVLDTVQAGEEAAVSFGAATAIDGTIDLVAGANVRVGAASTASGNIAVTATGGDVSGLANASPAIGGPLAGFDRGNLTAASAGRTISVSATAGGVQLGTLTAGTGATATDPIQIDVIARAIDISTATATNGALSLLATTGDLTLGIGSSGASATLRKTGAAGSLDITTGLTAVGNILLESAGAVEIGGAVSATGSASMIELRNIGTSATFIVAAELDRLDAAPPVTDFRLKASEVNNLNAGTVVIDSVDKGVTIGALAVDSDTGRESLRFLTTGDVKITGEIKGDGKEGTLQIGGARGAILAETVDPAELASTITADIGAGAKISFASGIVDLRAARIAFGTGDRFNAYVSEPDNTAVIKDVADAKSPIYQDPLANGQVFLTAKRLRVSYSDFALFQNTRSDGRGVELNAGVSPIGTGLALQLFSSGDNRNNAFALFGTVNGLIGQGAAVLPNGNLEISTPGSNPRFIRVTQASSRLNGCVIGSPDKGCLVNDPPRPNFSIYDQRQAQLFGAADDASLFFNPLVGRGNEGLIVDIADAPVGIDTIDCPPDSDDPSCPETGAPK